MVNIPVNVIFAMLGIFSFICMLSITFFKKQKKRFHWLMVLLQTVWSVRLFMYSLLYNPQYNSHSWVWPVFIISSLLYAPMFYLFTTDVSRLEGISRRDYLIFIPAGVITLYFIGLYSILDSDSIQRIHNCAILNMDALSDSEPMLIILEYVSYYSMRAFTFWLEAGVMVWCCICIYKYELTVKEYFSSDEGRSVSQAKIISALTAMSVIVIIILEAMPDYHGGMSVSKVMLVFVTFLLQLSLTLLAFSIQYSADDISIQLNSGTDDVPDADDSQNRQNSSITICWNKLEKLMREDKVFLEPDLNLIELAQRIGTNRTYVSQAVRMYSGKSFSDYVNHERIMYAQQQLLSGVALKDIEYTCGYISSSTFYRQFQKETGMSPGVWLNTQKKSAQNRVQPISGSDQIHEQGTDV